MKERTAALAHVRKRYRERFGLGLADIEAEDLADAGLVHGVAITSAFWRTRPGL